LLATSITTSGDDLKNFVKFLASRRNSGRLSQ
jgi:hypothetical protein